MNRIQSEYFSKCNFLDKDECAAKRLVTQEYSRIFLDITNLDDHRPLKLQLCPLYSVMAMMGNIIGGPGST